MDVQRKKLMNDFSFMSYAPIIFISAKTGQRVDRLFELIKFVDSQNAMRVTTGMLNDLLARATARVQPPSDKGKRLKIYYMTQIATRPPTFVCFCNSKQLFHFSYARYIENQIRETFGLEGTPVRIKDIRTFGSGNAGMTNVLRTFGKGAAALTIVGDIGKGILAVLLAKWAFGAFTAADPIYGAYIAAFCAVLGHVYPVYFGFKGGKAVSVATGTIIAIKPVLILPLLAVFFIVFLCSKMVSLASICCAAAYPAVTFLYFHFVAGRDVVLTTCCAAVIGGLVIWLHRSNIQRIKNGTEYKFGRKKK